MNDRLVRRVYEQFPSGLRSATASIAGISKNRRRYGGVFQAWVQFFKAAHQWTEDQLREFQSTQLREQVQKALIEVPYYQELFARLGLSASEIQSLADLHRLPLLEKSQVIEAGNKLISRAWPERQLKYYPTSGSTGTPLLIPRPSYIEQMEWAFLRARFFPADTVGLPYSSFTGLELIPPNQSKPPFWVDNWTNQQRMYSIFHMNRRNLRYYVDSLDKRYSRFYLGYPSAIYIIAKFMQNESLNLKRPPEYIFTGSEELQPHYEDSIRTVFGSKILNRYGQSEFVGSITTYDCGHMHYDMDYSILEFLPVGEEDGAVLAEIVATNIHDTAWPLLRYRTGDLVVYDPNEHCAAGYPGQIIRRIHGRTGRYFQLPNGCRVTNISVIAKKCTNVKLMQVIQRKLGAIVVRVVPNHGFSSKDEEKLIREFRVKLGVEIKIDIEYVEDIERTSSGKYISIVNEVEQDY